MDYSTTVSTQGQATPVSLYDAIGQLNEVSWQINNLIFGELPMKQPEGKVSAGDKLTEARNQIQEITIRLGDAKDRLSMIGA